jgi:hypothetical protein
MKIEIHPSDILEQTHTYSNEDRAAIKHLLAVYKLHRPEIFSGYVFPMGAGSCITGRSINGCGCNFCVSER